MKNKRINILICGLLWSGSSAIVDLMKEFDNIGFVPGEFNEFRRPGMVGDYLDGRINEYYPSNLNSFTQAKNGRFVNIKSYVKKILPFHKSANQHQEKLLDRRKKELIKLKDSLNSQLSQRSKMEKSREWISKIGDIYAKDKSFILFDQPLLLGQHFNIWPNVFNPFKLIIVYRNPKDQLAEIIRQHHLFYHMRSPIADIYGGDRLGAIKYQIDTLCTRLDWAEKIEKTHGQDNVMMISFEKLVIEYEITLSKIKKFLGINANYHTEKGNYFKPDESIKNIGIYNNYLTSEETVLLQELEEWYHHKEKFH